MTRTSIAKALIRHAAAVMPARRSEWAEAMLAEVEHLPAGERWTFAAGCVWSGYRERLSDAATLLTIGRWSVGLGLCAATVVCLRAANRLQGQPASAMVLMLGLVAFAAAGAFAWRGVRLLPTIAAAGLAAALTTIAAVGDLGALLAGTLPSSDFHRAIAIEQMVCWALLFAIAQVLLRLDGGRRAHG